MLAKTAFDELMCNVFEYELQQFSTHTNKGVECEELVLQYSILTTWEHCHSTTWAHMQQVKRLETFAKILLDITFL